MITDRIRELCDDRGTSLTALCKEVTGSSGNTATWNKDRVRSDWLREICKKLSVSADYLLELSDNKQISVSNSSESVFAVNSSSRNNSEWMDKINKLPVNLQYELKGYLNRLLEEAAENANLKQAK